MLLIAALDCYSVPQCALSEVSVNVGQCQWQWLTVLASVIFMRWMMQVKKVREYMKDPKFTVDDIRSISTAGAGLLKWVFAMVNYYR